MPTTTTGLAPGFRFDPPYSVFQMPVIGDCMEPVIYAGDLVEVERDRAPHDGDVVVFEHLDNGILCKQYRVEPDGVHLVALNVAIDYPLSDRIRIVGVVTSTISPINAVTLRRSHPRTAMEAVERQRKAAAMMTPSLLADEPPVS